MESRRALGLALQDHLQALAGSLDIDLPERDARSRGEDRSDRL
jgi:hypothetical protein